MVFSFFFGWLVFWSVAYVALMIFVFHHWSESKYQDKLQYSTPTTQISIIIVARNEANHIASCLDSILANNYPESLFEIIVVDDHSDDDTEDIIKNYTNKNVVLLSLQDCAAASGHQNSYKKLAINYALTKAKGELIITTDADSIVGLSWLRSFDYCYSENEADFIAAPVISNYQDGALERFQALDFAGMMGVTAAGIQSNNWYMANGANMAFRKSVIDNVNLYTEKEKTASGDDIYMIHHFAIHNKNIKFLNHQDAKVLTQPVDNWSSLYHQRIRWATKNKHTKSIKYLLMMAIPYIAAINIFVALVLGILGIPLAMLFFVIGFLLKISIDYFYLNTLSEYYGEQKNMKNYLMSSIIHTLYIVIIGTLSFVIRKYNWKGRTVS